MEVASRLLIGGYVRRDSPGPTTAQTMNHGSRVAEKAESRAKKVFFQDKQSLTGNWSEKTVTHMILVLL